MQKKTGGIMLKKITLNIFLLLLCSSCLFAETYTVKQDGTGDFTTIQAAINYVVDDDVIFVYEGTYNEQIYFLGKNILVYANSQFVEETIISYPSTPFVGVVNFSDGESDAEINGFTIQGGYIGVNITNCDSPKIQNCKIQNNDHGIFVRLYNYTYSSTPEICNNEISFNETGIKCFDDTHPNIYSNVIKNCNIGIYGYGIDVDRMSFPTIYGNEIFDNNYGIRMWYSHVYITGCVIYDNNVGIDNSIIMPLPQPFPLLVISTCLIYDNIDYGIKISDRTTIDKTTITQNTTGVCFLSAIPLWYEIINSILWDNTSTFWGYNSNYVTVTYSDLPELVGNNNIHVDPLFDNPGNSEFTLEWSSTEKSPCIDAGNPDHQYADPDGTKADMGAFYYPHEVKTYDFPNANTDRGWKWLCYDILDRTVDPYNIAENMLDPIKDPSIFEHADCKTLGTVNEYIEIDYDPEPPPGQWTNGDHVFTSPQGYKFQTLEQCWLAIPGFRCESTTTFPILGRDEPNWIGYFLEETQHVYDAFYGYLDNIYKIQAQQWSVENENGWPDVPYTLSPGDMVVVWCRDDILNFSWVNDTPREAFNVEKAQNFTFSEEADYIPIYMQLNPEDLPTEIGALIDGECQGATVVQDTSAQICAYILGSQGNMEFEFYYGGRSENKVIREYNIYDPKTSHTEKGSIKVDNNRGSYYVSFKNEPESTPAPVKLEASNYPNPFNPVTTIAYSLPEDSQISISIFNIKGQEVKELTSGIQPAGNYNITWNGKDESGKDVTSGIYFYKLKTNGKELTRKMLMLK